MRLRSCTLLALAVTCLHAGEADTKKAKALPGPDTPFGAEMKPALRKILERKAPFQQPVAGFADATAWRITGDQRVEAAGYALGADGVLALDIAGWEPRSTMVGLRLPVDEGGDAWGEQEADCITFLCQAEGAPARMAAYLCLRGKEPEDTALRAPFEAVPGAWRRVALPLSLFGAKNANRVAEIGFTLTGASDPAHRRVLIKDLRVAGSRIDDSSSRMTRASIPLHGTWRFQADPQGQGAAAGWAAAGFDDRAWGTLMSGKPWQAQGVANAGDGWYRQRFVIPAGLSAGEATVRLSSVPLDDEVYINGERIGATRGIYRYPNYEERGYPIPRRLLRSDQPNTIAIRTWGIDGSRWGRRESGLVKDDYAIDIEPYPLMARAVGATSASEVAVEAFDLSEGQYRKPFELVLHLPAEAAPAGSTADITVVDSTNELVFTRSVAVGAAEGTTSRVVVAVSPDEAQDLYLRGVFKVHAAVIAGDGAVVSVVQRVVERPKLAARDAKPLPPLPETWHDTAYGKLRLIDDIDCSLPIDAIPHPYAQGTWSKSKGEMPGAAVQVDVREILGRKARESATGWFAYRIGRGVIKPGQHFVVSVDYPEDKPRYGTVQIETGNCFAGVGWRNGVSPDDPHDDYPISKRWETMDTIVVAEERTFGHQGAEGASSEHGFWVFVANKINPNKYFAMYPGGPAVSRIRLYAIDPAKDAPVIRKPAGQPQRFLGMDWERQPDHDPAGVAGYARLMGYNTVSPIVLKWCTTLWADPLPGFKSSNIDLHGYWVDQDPPAAPVAGPPTKDSIHARYLAATAANGLDYYPRIEYGGSMNLPKEARAIGTDGRQAKTNRIAPWSSNLLHPAVWDDYKLVLDHLIGRHAKDHPQLKGAYWRIRADTMQISYGRDDIQRYCTDAKVAMPDGGPKDIALWASIGAGSEGYRGWWLEQRAAFHRKVRDQLRSYRPDMELLYYNWDVDKWCPGVYDQTTAAYFADLGQAGPGMAMLVYQRNVNLLRKLTGADFATMIRRGELSTFEVGGNTAGNKVHYAFDNAPYRGMDGFRSFAPANYRYLADRREYLEAFRTGAGVAVAHAANYDENSYKRVHPKWECNMTTPAGPAFSMAVEVMAWFHSDARALTWTPYTFARAFANAHRRFAQAYLALPAVDGAIIDGTPDGIRARLYPGQRIGLATIRSEPVTIQLSVPGTWQGSPQVTDLASGSVIPATVTGGALRFQVDLGPMELRAFAVGDGR